MLKTNMHQLEHNPNMNIHRKVRISSRLLKFVSVLALVITLLVSIDFYISNQKICTNPYELKDFTSSIERVEVCNNKIYKGSTQIVSKDEYPDLFEFKLNDKSEKLKQYVRVFEKDKAEYISIKSIMDYTSWNTSSIGIYRKENNEYTLVFKKGFDDSQGRWVDIEFGEDYSYRDRYFYLNARGEGLTISGDIGYLGCYGECRLLWWDHYDWDSKKRTFVLANNKHPDEFQKLLESYEDFDKNRCQDEAGVNKSISELYKIRKDKEKICGDGVGEPATTPEQAKMLLKGMRAINLILDGKNISINDVGGVELN